MLLWLINMANYYYCESYGGWFVCYADTKREAEKCLRGELGNIKEVRRATPEEVENYCVEKGIDKLNTRWYSVKDEDGVWKEDLERNRQFQMKAI